MPARDLRIGVVGALTIDFNKSSGSSYGFLGGGGFYSSVSLAGMGVETFLFTGYGPDMDAEWVGKLRKTGVRIVAQSFGKSIVFENFYEGSSRVQKASGSGEKIFVERSMLKDLHAVHVTPVLNEVDHRVLEEAAEAGCRVSVDAQGFIRSVGEDGYVVRVKRLLSDGLIEHIDYIHMSLEEQLFFLNNSVRELFDLNPGIIVEITDSEHGSFVMDRKRCYRIPAFKTGIVDPTGAGDVYASVFLAKHLEKNDLLEAGLYASASASIKVEKTGPLFSLDPGEVERRVEALRRVVESLY
jgi:sugar/nucleoside kinase (ribokinase family)